MQCLVPGLGRFIFVICWLKILQGNYLSAPPEVRPLGIASGSFPNKIFLVLPASVSAEPSVPPQIESCKHKVYPAVKHPPLLHTENRDNLLSSLTLPINLASKKNPITVHRQCCVTADQWRLWPAEIGSSWLLVNDIPSSCV